MTYNLRLWDTTKAVSPDSPRLSDQLDRDNSMRRFLKGFDPYWTGHRVRLLQPRT